MKLIWSLLMLWQLATNNANTEDSHQRLRRQTGAPCTSPIGEEGLCISILKCPSLLTMMKTDGKDPPVASFLRRSKCGDENRVPNVCCPDALEETKRLLPEPEAPSTTNKPVEVTPKQTTSSAPIQCGESALTSNRVVGGKDANLGNWPWMVGLSYKVRGAVNAPTNIKCGATLISNQWVITAAHCLTGSVLKDYELDFARLGDLDLDETVDDGAHPINAAIDKIIVHQEYSSEIKKNDIALLHLKNPVEFTTNLHPICLLSGPNYKRDEYYAPKIPFVTGWGATGWRGKSTTKLQEAQVAIVPPTKCAEQYSKVKGALINEKVICAGAKGKDTCQGDSGGPLIFMENKLFYLGGIVSYGIGCNTSVPGVYTKIAEFTDWINTNTGENF